MKPHRRIIPVSAALARLLALVPLAAALLAGAPARAALKYPESKVEVVRDTLHGVVIEDPYRWLEDPKSPETRDWIDRQMAFTKQLLAAIPGRDSIEARFTQLMKVESRGVPKERGGRYFFWTRAPDQEQRVLCMRQGLNGPDQVLLDPHPLSPDHTTSVSYLGYAEDGSVAMIGTRTRGEDEQEVSFMDVASKTPLPDRLSKSRYFSVSMTPDKRTVFYAKFEKQASRIYRHDMGTDAAKDALIFGEGLPTEQIPAAELSEDGRYLIITVYFGSAATRTQVYIKDLATGGPIVPIVADLESRFYAYVGGDRMYLWTDWKAPNGRVLAVDLAHPERERWREVVPESRQAIEDFSLIGGRLFVSVLEDVNSRVRIYTPGGQPQGEIRFPSLGSVSDLTGRWSGNEAFFTFASFHVPNTTFRYEVATGEQKEWWRSPVPVRSQDFELKQVWYKSKDGTRVPMFVLARKGLKLDGSHPTYLYGYGGFTVNMTPAFSNLVAAWVERGGVFAQPNLRGGSEFGEAWHVAGMLDKKQNVFDDFVAAAQWLIDNHYTGPERLVISGGSNGGLLVGAALTQRPELFRAVVCEVPLLDMLRYHSFMLGRFWTSEYGSSEDAQPFKTLYAYSPYHHVRKNTKYPAVMFVTGDSDTRVDPLHARKMCALMQASTGSDRPILLHYDTSTGHSGGKPVSRVIEDATDELLFLFGELGMAGGGSAAAGGAAK